MAVKTTLALRGDSTGSRRSSGRLREVPRLPVGPTSFTVAEARAAVRDVVSGVVKIVPGRITIRMGPLKYVVGKKRGRRTLGRLNRARAESTPVPRSTARPRRKR